MLVAAPSLALLPEASAALACSRRRWGLTPLGGFHLIGRIAPDRLGVNLPDRGFRLIGNKPHCGAGRPWRPLVIAGDALPAFIGARRAVLHQ